MVKRSYPQALVATKIFVIQIFELNHKISTM